MKKPRIDSKRRHVTLRGAIRLLPALVLALAILPVAVLVGLYAAGGYVKTPPRWWYPFVTSVLSDYYTTGPFAMTSNLREDNPVWADLPALNQSLARLSYAMSRGEPRIELAWLLAEAEWRDEPALGEGVRPNRKESPISRALLGAGFGYDRISRADLAGATAEGRRLRVGHGAYRALLVDGLTHAEPALLARVLELAEQGVPVVWTGALPHRATGWAERDSRDHAVRELAQQLRERVSLQEDPRAAVAALAAAGVQGALVARDPGSLGLRLATRELRDGDLVLLFNETDREITRSFQPVRRYGAISVLNAESGSREALSSFGGFTVTVPAGRTRLVLMEQRDQARDEGVARISTTGGVADAGLDGASLWDWGQWQHPPRAMHPYVRWWWPGNAVEADELRAELKSIHDAGFGGVELQTLTIGMRSRHLAEHEQQIYGVGTAAYFGNLKTVFEFARDLGMVVDLTLGSGWSSGGPFIDAYPEQQLLRASYDVVGPARVDRVLPLAEEPWYATPTNWIIKNTIGEFDRDLRPRAVVASRVDESTDPPTLTDLKDIGAHAHGGRLRWEAPEGHWRIHAIYQNATAHNVAASAYPGALTRSPVIDHLGVGGVGEYIEKLGEPWLDGIAPYRPDAFFVDSFELIGELPWTTGFEQAFREMHGYELTPYLPLVFMERGESKYVNVVLPPRPAYRSDADMAERVREDYEATRQRLFVEAFLKPLRTWTAARGIALRVQAHGGYGDYLDSYQAADIPESEGLFAGGSYEFLKLASSAAHVAGRRVVSSESFITMSSDFNALGIDDYYRLAGNAFAAGINRLVCHGYAYRYTVHGLND